MRIGYDKLIRTLGKNLAEFIGNLDFMHTVYMKTMYPMMDEPSFRAETREDGTLTLHYFSVRKGLNGVVSGEGGAGMRIGLGNFVCFLHFHVVPNIPSVLF